MADTIALDALQAAGEYTEGLVPDVIATELRNSDTADGVLGVLFDAYTSIPELAGPLIYFIAQRLKGRGGLTAGFGEVLETVPATSRMLRAITGKTTASARADMIDLWRRFRNNPAIGARMTTPAPAAAPATAPPAPPPTRIEKIIVDAYDHDGSMVVTAIAEILRKEGKPGVDLVRELEGDSNLALIAWLECVYGSATELKRFLKSDADAMIAVHTMDREYRRGLAEHPDAEKAWAKAAADLVRINAMAIGLAYAGYNHRHPGNPLVAKVEDLADALNGISGGEPRGKFAAMQAAKNIAIGTVQVGMAIPMVAMAYCLILLGLSVNYPDNLHVFSTWSFYGLMTISLLVILAGSFSRKPWVVAIQMTALFLAMEVWPILAGTGFVLATVLGSKVSWVDFAMGLVLVVGWHLVGIGLLQKGINALGSIEAGIARLFGAAFATKFSGLAKENQWLSRISTTIAYAVSLVWLFVYILNLFGVVNPTRLYILGGVVVVVLAAAMVSSMINTYNMSSVAPHLRKAKEATDVTDYKAAKIAARYVVPIGVVLAVLLVAVFGITQLQSWGAGAQAGTTRVADKALSWVNDRASESEPATATQSVAFQPVETPVRSQPSVVPRNNGAMMDCGKDGQISASEVRKAKESLGFNGPTSMYPWECR